MTTPYLTPPVFSWPAAPGGKLHTYLAGGTVAQATYSDAAGVTPNTNPVTLDSLGSAVVRLAVGVAYHFVLKDSLDVTTLWDADNFDNAYLASSGVTAAIVGAALYPQTTPETNGGVTVIAANLIFPPGDLRRYGATLNGNITTSLANAVSQALQPGGAPVYIPAALGTGCTVTAGVTVTAPIQVKGDGLLISAINTSADITIFSLTLAASQSEFKDFGLFGMGLGATQPAILATNCNDCYMDQVRINKFGVGLRLAQGANSSYLWTLRSCQIYSNNLINIDAQRLSNGLKMIDCTFGGGVTGATITGITKAASAVVTISTASAVNPFAVNQIVWFGGVLGMTQINGQQGATLQVATVTAIGGVSGAWTVTVNVNSSGYGVYTSGGTLTSATTGLKFIDSNILAIYGGDCEGTSYCCIDIDAPGGGTYGNQGVLITGVDFEGCANNQGDIRIGNTSVVNGVTIIGGYVNPGVGDDCHINAVNSNGLSVFGTNISAGFYGGVGYIRKGATFANERILYGQAFNVFENNISNNSRVARADSGVLTVSQATDIDANFAETSHFNSLRGNAGSFAANKDYAAGFDAIRIDGTGSAGAGSVIYARRCQVSNAVGGTNVRAIGAIGGALDQSPVTLTYSASINIRVSDGNSFTVTVTDANAFTFNAPINPPPASGVTQFITLTVRNTSGGGLGAVTFNAIYKLAAWVSPATANSRSITFKWDGTNWIEASRTPNDVPN